MSVVPWNQLDPAESPYVKLFGLVGIPFAAGIINFVVLTAAASSCNSGIFANSRTLFGLAGRKQGPPFLHKTNKHGVPYYAILLTCGLLSIAIILNAVFKDATKVFVQITTFSTVLNIMIWTCIMIAYLGFVKRNPELHNDSKFKMPGGKYMAYAILAFAFIFIVLLINSTFAVLFAPEVMYQKYRTYEKRNRWKMKTFRRELKIRFDPSKLNRNY